MLCQRANVQRSVRPQVRSRIPPPSGRIPLLPGRLPEVQARLPEAVRPFPQPVPEIPLLPHVLDIPRIRALVFDIDGTLSDTDDHLVAQVGAVLGRVPGLSGRRAGRLARRIVMAAETPTNALYGLLDETGLDAALRGLRRLSARLRAQRQRATTRPAAAADEIPHDMVPDVAEMLHVLAARFPMSTISTGHVPRIEAFLAHHGVRSLFAAVAGAETTPRMKPFADPLLFAARAMNVPPDACLVIGDTTVDMLTARAGGAQAVGVLCGFGTRAELVRTGAGLILDTTSDLLGVLAPAADPLAAGGAAVTTAAPTVAPPAAAPPAGSRPG